MLFTINSEADPDLFPEKLIRMIIILNTSR